MEEEVHRHLTKSPKVNKKPVAKEQANPLMTQRKPLNKTPNLIPRPEVALKLKLTRMTSNFKMLSKKQAWWELSLTECTAAASISGFWKRTDKNGETTSALLVKFSKKENFGWTFLRTVWLSQLFLIMPTTSTLVEVQGAMETFGSSLATQATEAWSQWWILQTSRILKNNAQLPTKCLVDSNEHVFKYPNLWF